ncbi:MAG: hypothetical protein EOS59_29570, partial [Mesorhizobium sp.]
MSAGRHPLCPVLPDRGGANDRDASRNEYCTSQRPPMSNRYATIIIDDDGREVVSAIGQFEGVP